MPNINLSRVLLSPMLADHVTVLRRTQTINQNGRVVVSGQSFARVPGTVTMAGPDQLDRLPDEQRMGRVISFVSKFKVQGPAVNGITQFQPDYLVWYGDFYVVTTLDPYPQFGSGFTQAIAYCVDSVSKQPGAEQLTAGALQFDTNTNGAWAALVNSKI